MVKDSDTTNIHPTVPQNKVKEEVGPSKKLVKKIRYRYHLCRKRYMSGESEQLIASNSSRKYEQGLYSNPKKKLQHVIVLKWSSGILASVSDGIVIQIRWWAQLCIDCQKIFCIRSQSSLNILAHRAGQYQHDMDQKRLAEALLGAVVEDCVNSVGWRFEDCFRFFTVRIRFSESVNRLQLL